MMKNIFSKISNNISSLRDLYNNGILYSINIKSLTGLCYCVTSVIRKNVKNWALILSTWTKCWKNSINFVHYTYFLTNTIKEWQNWSVAHKPRWKTRNPKLLFYHHLLIEKVVVGWANNIIDTWSKSQVWVNCLKCKSADIS